MRLSRLADFAVVSMAHVARFDDRVHTAAEIAEATQLPAPAVAKVLARLCREGLLSSIRGAKGGYALARPAGEITVRAIVDALEGPIALTQCIKSGPGGCGVEFVCPSRLGLHRVNMAIRKALEDVTLADIIEPIPALAFGPNGFSGIEVQE